MAIARLQCGRSVFSSNWRLGLARTGLYGLGLVALSVCCLAYEPPSRIVFGGDAAYPPLEWLEAHRAKGFNVALAQELARVGGSRAEHRLGNWNFIMHALEQGQLDVVPMYYSPARAKHFIFTQPYYFISHAIYALPSAPRVSSIADLAGKRVALEESSYAHQQFTRAQLAPELILTPNTLQALQRVRTGAADYAVLAVLAADTLVREREWELVRMGPPFWSRGYAFAVNKNQPELAEWLQESLNATIASGRFQALYDDWHSQLEPGEASLTQQRWALVTLAALACLAVFGGSAYWGLTRTIRLRTRELRAALAERDQIEADLVRAAHYDQQTGLAKAAYFIDQMDDFFHRHSLPVREEKEVLVLELVDLDDMVRTFGFARAEMVVNRFAAQLQRLPEVSGAYLGRGVFALFANKGSHQQLFAQLGHPTHQQELGMSSRFVAGVAYWPEQGRSATKLLRHAETALATSVLSHKRFMVYDAAMEPSRLDLDVIALFIEGQVEGIYPVFQPQLDLRTGKVVGAEVLVRWWHPRLGQVAPNVFIPLLENSGLIEQITAQMLDQAVRVSAQLREWGLGCVLSVNIAAYDVMETPLVDLVQQALARHQGRAVDLKLELTETSVAANPQWVKQVLTELWELGVGIAVDDFGTGYSSLSYLSNFPIRELKIDQSFVRDMRTNERNHSIVRSTILMARELGLITLAEGVEDDKTLQLLRRDGCDFAQGFVIARPLPEAEFIEYMRAHASQGFELNVRR